MFLRIKCSLVQTVPQPHLLGGLCCKSEDNSNDLFFFSNTDGSYVEAKETVAVLFGNFGEAKEV